MTESIVLPLLVEAAKPMVKVAVSRVAEEMHFFRGFKKELSKLLGKIQMIEKIVLQMTVASDEAVKPWLKNILRIIYSADDMVDMLAYEKHRGVVMKRRPPKTFTKKIRGFVCSPLKRVYFRSKMGSWIRRINSDIEAALKEADTIFQLRALAQSASSEPTLCNVINDQPLQQVRRNVDTSIFIGRHSDVQSVVDMLLCNPSQDSHGNISSKQLSVMAIVGIGGCHDMPLEV